MKPFDVLAETRALLATHRLHDWSVGWDQAKRRAGACHYSKKKITYSRHLAHLYPVETMRQVMLHEVGHALSGPKAGHGKRWADVVRALGGTPTVRLPSHLPQVEARWRGACPQCGAERHLHSAPRRVISCGKCSSKFSVDLVFDWFLEDVETIPPGKYARELNLIKRSHKTRGQAGHPQRQMQR